MPRDGRADFPPKIRPSNRPLKAPQLVPLGGRSATVSSRRDTSTTSHEQKIEPPPSPKSPSSPPIAPARTAAASSGGKRTTSPTPALTDHRIEALSESEPRLLGAAVRLVAGVDSSSARAPTADPSPSASASLDLKPRRAVIDDNYFCRHERQIWLTLMRGAHPSLCIATTLARSRAEAIGPRARVTAAQAIRRAAFSLLMATLQRYTCLTHGHAERL